MPWLDCKSRRIHYELAGSEDGRSLSDQRVEGNTTRATARLRGLDIDISPPFAHKAEQISINLQAMPSFEAFGQFLETATLWTQADRRDGRKN